MIAEDFAKEQPSEMMSVKIELPPAGTLSLFLVNSENPDALSAVRKICRDGYRPGAFILLTQAEFDAVTNPNEVRPFP